MASQGTYRGRAITSTAKLIRSKNKNTPGIEVVIDMGPQGTMTWTGWITGGATEFTIRSMRAMGWQGDDLADLSTLGTKECEVVVVEEEYKGNYYPKIAFINELGGRGNASSQEMTDAERRAFAAEMRGTVLAANGGKPSSKTQRTAPPAERRQEQQAPHEPPGSDSAPDGGDWAGPPEDDDIPF